MDLRQLNGLEIAARRRLVFSQGAWRVPSQNGSATYRVILQSGQSSCDCEDFQLRLQPCKHIHAARLVQERDHGGLTPTCDTGTIAKRPTYKQCWPAYNLAQTTEKHRLQELLCDLCRTIEEPPLPKIGRHPHRASDAVFAMALKVYSLFSGRRFHGDLQSAHSQGYLSNTVPGAKVCAFFENPVFTPILQQLIIRSSLPLQAVETVFAPDSTGFSTSRFVRWFDEKYGVTRSGKAWVKAHVICGVKTNIATAVEILDKNAADCPQLPGLVRTTADHFKVAEVAADKAYLSKDNLAVIAQIGAAAYIPFKVNSVSNGESEWDRLLHYYQFRREEFLKHYHQRSNAESTFSMVKAKFRDHVRSKTETAMKNEVLCKFLCHNICCVIQSQCELGIELVFWPKEPPAENNTEPDLLPLVRPG
jgi:transposase